MTIVTKVQTIATMIAAMRIGQDATAANTMQLNALMAEANRLGIAFKLCGRTLTPVGDTQPNDDVYGPYAAMVRDIMAGGDPVTLDKVQAQFMRRAIRMAKAPISVGQADGGMYVARINKRRMS